MKLLDPKDSLKKVGRFASIAGGLGAGSFVMKKAPSTLPWYVPGAGAIVLAVGILAFSKNEYLDNAAYGIGSAGVLDLGKKAGANIPFLSVISDQLPALGGAGDDRIILPQQNLLSGGMRGMRGMRGADSEMATFQLLS